jgi:hypothetical protein
MLVLNEFRQKSLAVSSFRAVGIAQRAMNSAISAMVFPDFLNKKRVFGAKTPCHYSNIIATH